MKITVEHYDYKISIEHSLDGQSFDDLIDNFIRPIILAMGFTSKTVENYFDNKN